MDKEEIRNVNIQFYTLFFSLLSIIISIILTYNDKLSTEGKTSFLGKKTNYNLTLFNRILILSIAIAFLYVNYKSYMNAKTKEKKLKSYELQILASLFTLIAASISLYVVSVSTKETLVDLENPVI